MDIDTYNHIVALRDRLDLVLKILVAEFNIEVTDEGALAKVKEQPSQPETTKKPEEPKKKKIRFPLLNKG